MTGKRDIDQLIHTFMDEGPAELSPRLLSSIRDEINGTNQRALPRPWRTLSMPRPILLFAVLGAILVAFGAMTIAGIGGRSQVTSPSLSSGPSLSPSPSTSAVTAYPIADGEPWILVGAESGAILIKPDGTGRHTILDDLPVAVVTPRWSNDGSQIVFEGNGGRGSQLWAANADGTGAHALMPTPDGCPNATCTEGLQPNWSPDGRSIAYVAVTHERGGFIKSALAVLDVATGTTTELYSSEEVSFARPWWSPDSRSIVFEIDRFEGRPEATRLVSSSIAVMDIADRVPREITDPSLLAGYPSWHPTAEVIVFRTNRFETDTNTLLDRTKPSDLYTIRPGGQAQTRVTDNGVGGPIVRGPTFTPDGRILYGKLERPTADEILTVISGNGSGEQSATGGITTTGEGHWRPGT
jgi:Tol biopolymer transport system component